MQRLRAIFSQHDQASTVDDDTRLPSPTSRMSERTPVLASTAGYGTVHSPTTPPTLHRRRNSRRKRRLRSLAIASTFMLSAGAVWSLNKFTTHDLVDDLISAIENLSSCTTCKSLLFPLKTIALLGDETFLTTLMTICTGLAIQDVEVCHGALGAQSPIIAHSLRSMSLSSTTGTLFCTKTFGLCDYPKIRKWKIPFPTTTSQVNVSKPSKRKRSTPLKVVHMTDLHIDREYSVGSDAVCQRNLCCRRNQPSDLPDHVIQEPAGPYGNHNCDSPVTLYISMLKAMRDFVPDLDFVVHTGDTIDHAVWKSDRSDVEDGIGQGTSQFLTHTNATMYGVIGNHDIAPTNSFPRNTTITTLSSQWDLELFSSVWQPWIGQDGSRSVRELSGCYSVIHPGTRLKVISLNTNLWYKANFWLYDSDQFQPDPNGMFAWLIQELEDAKVNGLKVWILGHMSPGKTDCLREQSNYFNQILRRYNNTISASMYGHTHRAEFEIVYEDPKHPSADTAMGIHYIAPALTPESGNPAFRVYTVDGDTYEILDFQDVVTNMDDEHFQQSPTWFEYYSARASYGSMLDPPLLPLNDGDGGSDDVLNGKFWHKVTEAMESQYEYFQQFSNRQNRGGVGQDVRPCWFGPCMRRLIQHLRSSESEFNGDSSSAGLNIESNGSDESHHTCGDLSSTLLSKANQYIATREKIVVPQHVRQQLKEHLKQATRGHTQSWSSYIPFSFRSE